MPAGKADGRYRLEAFQVVDIGDLRIVVADHHIAPVEGQRHLGRRVSGAQFGDLGIRLAVVNQHFVGILPQHEKALLVRIGENVHQLTGTLTMVPRWSGSAMFTNTFTGWGMFTAPRN